MNRALLSPKQSANGKSVWATGVGAGCWLLRGCERLGPFNSYKIATERHFTFKICLITNFESLISFLALNSCKKVYLNIFGVYFCMSMSRTAPWAHPWSLQVDFVFFLSFFGTFSGIQLDTPHNKSARQSHGGVASRQHHLTSGD